MQIVIDIPEEIYKASQVLDVKYEDVIQIPLEVIANGTPLPKWHGDLVDISPYKGKVICSRLYSGVKKFIEVDSIEPIIESR